MKWILRLVYMLTTILLLASLGFYLYQNYQPTPPTEQTAFTHEAQTAQEQPGIIHAIAIDMDHNNIVTHKTIQSGDDSLLVIKADAKSIKDIAVGDASNKIYIFNGMGSVAKHINDFDGWLNPSNLIFNELQLMNLKRFHSEKRMMTLQNAGVNALFFNPHYLEEVRKDIEAPIGEEIGYAIMSDSSQRIMKIVGIPASFLK